MLVTACLNIGRLFIQCDVRVSTADLSCCYQVSCTLNCVQEACSNHLIFVSLSPVAKLLIKLSMDLAKLWNGYHQPDRFLKRSNLSLPCSVDIY